MDSFGAFTQCMVDGDPESLRRERKNRRFGLAVSVTFQVALVAALVLIPLMSQAVPPQWIRINQIPLLQVPPRIEVVQSPASSVAPQRPIFNIASAPAAPVFYRALAEPNPVGIDLNPEGIGPADGATSILGTPGLPKPPEMPAARQPDRPVMRGGNVMEAMLINRVEPRYPAIATAAHMSGDVVHRHRRHDPKPHRAKW